jgi:two-component system response regulator AtoC
MGGLEFLKRYGEVEGEALVIVMTAYGNMELAVEAMKAGAYDYLPKPFGADEVLLTIRKAEEREQLRSEVGRLRAEVSAERRLGDIVARSPTMIKALETATKVARHRSPVLLTGESGTGKELIARLIHRESDRADGPFVPVNCGAIPETLLESEFFGYMRGAFTGADRDRAGLFEAAEGGTLFLDEVGELSTALQVKLLRALQEGEIRRLGGTDTSEVDVRIVSATNIDLQAAVQSGDFRQDFYYRLAVIPIHLPPLRERTEAIPDLTRHLLERLRERLNVKVAAISPSAMKLLLAYPWPGNIRELENVLEQAAVLSGGAELEEETLAERLRHTAGPIEATYESDDLSVKRRSAELERQLIQRALKRTGGNRSKAGLLLELSPRALRYKIQDYGLDGA